MENKTKNTQKVINLSQNINPYNFGEYSYGTRWVSFGEDNDYDIYLRDLYLESPTHQAIIDGTVNMATGEGVEVKNPEGNPMSNKWLNDNFDKKTVKSLISDLKTYGYCTVEVYSGNVVKYSEAGKYRFGQKNDYNQIDSMWFSEDWQYHTYKKNRPIQLPIYVQGTTEDLSILVMTLERHSMIYYAPVDYAASTDYIQLEAEIAKYHLANIRNGLTPSMVLTFIGQEFSDEDMNLIERQINEKFGGSTNAGRAIIGFSSSKDDATVVDVLENNNLSETYQFLSKETTEKIMIGHGVTSPIIFGLRDTGGGLGNNAEELAQSFYLYYETKLKHYQEYILNMIKEVMYGNLLFAEIEFVTPNPFENDKNTEELSKVVELSEVNTQEILNKIDKLKVKTDGILINEKLFSGELDEKALYKFVKASKTENIITKKYEILDKQGFVFSPDESIKNTKDFYWMEQNFLNKKNK